MPIDPTSKNDTIDFDVKMIEWITNITSRWKMLEINASHGALVDAVRYFWPDLRLRVLMIKIPPAAAFHAANGMSP